jgi:hypothetical protein
MTQTASGSLAASPFALQLDTRLIAAVQSRAGARCHQSGNLLHSYYLCADLCRCRIKRGDAEASKAAWKRFLEIENRLREFLFNPCPEPKVPHACVA